MSTYNTTGSANTTVAAIFTNRDAAHEALRDLHDAGYRDAWLGVTRADQARGTAPELEGASGAMNSIGRFFSGDESETSGLHQALVRRGMTETQAREVDNTIAPGNAIVTVGAENDYEEASEILTQSGGHLIGETGAYGASLGTAATVADTTRTTDQEARRLQLREERLSIDKQRVGMGEATVGKTVTSERQSIDVPVYHEELYIERRPASGTTQVTGTIGDGKEIIVELEAERVNVSKSTIVREEVAVGQRRVEGVEHVEDTVRREELRVDDPSATTTTTRGTTKDPLI